MNNLRERVEQTIRERRLLPRGARVLVAVSGGLDSMVLLHLLHALSPSQRWQLRVAHFNHQLRGRSSDADERLVVRTAKALGVPVKVERGAVKLLARRRRISLEMAARELRHAFFAHTAKANKVCAVVLAHHADDQVELFFLRLLRGSGGEGLAGMKWRSPSPVAATVQLVRPLLDVTRAELEHYACANKIPFREDASNADRGILRNRIRHDLLPLLRRRYQPAIHQTVRRLMEIVGAESEFVTDAARVWLGKKRRPLFQGLPTAVQRRVLQLQLQQQQIAADYELVESLRVTPDQPFSINARVSVLRQEGGVVQTREQPVVAFNRKHRVMSLGGWLGQVVFDGVGFDWRFDAARKFTRPKRRAHSESFDADQIGEQIVLRHWQPGDRYQPIGMKTAIKLQDWFTNRKIPRARRHELIVAVTGSGEIFWVEGQRIGERFKLTSSTRRRLIWRWQRA